MALNATQDLSVMLTLGSSWFPVYLPSPTFSYELTLS